MSSKKNSVIGPVAMAASEVPERGVPRGQPPVSPQRAKALAFWARMQVARKTPGHCSRCGRVNPDPPRRKGKQGICQRCRDELKAWKLKKRQVAVTVDGVLLAELKHRVALLELRYERFAKFARVQYKNGYAVGVKAERKRWAEMPRDWDSWAQPMDITVKRQHSHAMPEEKVAG